MIGNAGDRSAQSERGQRIGQGAIHPTDGRERISPRAGCAGLHLDAVEHHGMTSFIVISIENRSKRGKISGWSETNRSEEHTSELQSLMRISYAVFCLKKKKKTENTITTIIRVNNVNKQLHKHKKLY